jgi:formylglycine-generating enzyme required for sulfatase activity
MKKHSVGKCFVLAFGVLLCLSGCIFKSPKLQTLENTIATIQPTKGHEIDRYTRDEGTSLGKPVYAEVLIVYEPNEHYTKKDVLDEIVAILEKNNWKREDTHSPGAFIGTLRQDQFIITVTAAIFSKENRVSLSMSGRLLSSEDLVTASTTGAPSFTPLPLPTTTQTGLIKVIGKDGMALLYVPAGEFTMGSDNGELGEKPVHTVYLDAFWIDQTEVTNEMYAKCVQAGRCNPPVETTIDYFNLPDYAKHPVVFVNWEMANTYCSWAGRRLPTEAEWEKAARGTDAFPYPWGEGIDCGKANYQSSCVHETSPVGSFALDKSPYGAYDMAGNVWEWVNDWYADGYYQNSPASNPLGPDTGQYRSLRGGDWAGDDFNARSAFRGRLDPAGMSNYYGGFRCAHSVP